MARLLKSVLNCFDIAGAMSPTPKPKFLRRKEMPSRVKRVHGAEAFYSDLKKVGKDFKNALRAYEINVKK